MRLARKSDTKNVAAVVRLLNSPKKPATPASSGNEAVTTLLKGNATAKKSTENRTDEYAIKRISGETRTKSKPARRSSQRFDLFLETFSLRKYPPAIAWVTVSATPSRAAYRRRRLSVPSRRAIKPVTALPITLPRIPALVNNGNSLFAWRASHTSPAIFQTKVPRIILTPLM